MLQYELVHCIRAAVLSAAAQEKEAERKDQEAVKAWEKLQQQQRKAHQLIQAAQVSCFAVQRAPRSAALLSIVCPGQLLCCSSCAQVSCSAVHHVHADLLLWITECISAVRAHHKSTKQQQ